MADDDLSQLDALAKRDNNIWRIRTKAVEARVIRSPYPGRRRYMVNVFELTPTRSKLAVWADCQTVEGVLAYLADQGVLKEGRVAP